jgi:hypothetical protein
MLMLVPMGQTGGGSIYEQEISKVCDRRNSKLISSDTYMRNEMKHEGAHSHAGNFASYFGGWDILCQKGNSIHVRAGIRVSALLVADLYRFQPLYK